MAGRVVAVERKVRDDLYGKIQRRTAKFVAHNENNEAKVGDLVNISESRPLSRRKRWVVTQVVEKAKQHNAQRDTNQRRCAPLCGGETAQSCSGSFPKLRSPSP